ncbi:hypothetical protein [Streptomyces sp. SGAir0957]
MRIVSLLPAATDVVAELGLTVRFLHVRQEVLNGLQLLGPPGPKHGSDLAPLLQPFSRTPGSTLRHSCQTTTEPDTQP